MQNKKIRIRGFFPVFTIILFFLVSCFDPVDVAPVDPGRTYSVAYELAGVIGMRPNPDPDLADETSHYPSQGILAAGEYLFDLFIDYGLVDVHFQEFTFFKYNDDDRKCTGRNVGGTIIGNLYPESIIVIGAHYDSIPGGIGSEDNASGVATMMEIARYFSDHPPAYTLRIVAFDAEESWDNLVSNVKGGNSLNGSRFYHDQAIISGEVDKTVLMYSLDESQSNYSDPSMPDIWFTKSKNEVLKDIYKEVKKIMGVSGLRVKETPVSVMTITGSFLSDIAHWQHDEVQHVWPWAYAPRSVYHAEPGSMDQISEKGLAIVTKMSLEFLKGVQEYPPEILNPKEPATKIGLTYGTGQSLLNFIGIDVHENYVNAIKENNGAIVKFSVFDNDEDINEKLEALHGVLIPGGYDVDPSFYEEQNHEKLEVVDRCLDILEFRVLQYAKEKYLPILAICRGHQVLNVSFGGSLYQDIPSQVHEEEEVIHRISEGGCFHDIAVKEDTRLYAIMEEEVINVNSSHHQGVKILGEGLITSAVAADGVIEGIEGNGDQFIMGVQFHPEILRNEKSEFNAIFEAFMVEAFAMEQLEKEPTKNIGLPH